MCEDVTLESSDVRFEDRASRDSAGTWRNTTMTNNDKRDDKYDDKY